MNCTISPRLLTADVMQCTYRLERGISWLAELRDHEQRQELGSSLANDRTCSLMVKHVVSVMVA
jgi:hypothetical protein